MTCQPTARDSAQGASFLQFGMRLLVNWLVFCPSLLALCFDWLVII